MNRGRLNDFVAGKLLIIMQVLSNATYEWLVGFATAHRAKYERTPARSAGKGGASPTSVRSP